MPSQRPYAFVVALSLLAASAAAANLSSSVSQPAALFLGSSASGCTNNPVPFITLNGELKLGGIDARIILTNNARFTHVSAADVTVDAVLIPAGQSIRIAKQPPQGGVGGNPYLHLQFNDCKGTSLSTPMARRPPR